MNSQGIASEPEHGFADRVRSAVIWRWGSQVAGQLITWTATILVVRLLSPQDYGLFAMTQAVLTILNVINGSGFATSLIQTKDIDDRRIGQVFGLLILSNLILASAQLIAAPFAAAYYGQPVVATMLQVQALLYVATPFTALQSVLLARQLDFHRQAKVNLICACIGAGVSFGLAWLGYGMWALVWAPIAVFATRGVGLTIAARKLVWPVFNFRGSGDIIAFGSMMTLGQVFWILQSQSDIVIAGRAFSPHDLGLYSESLFLTLIFTGRFLPPLNEVAYPAYAELNNAGKSLAPAFLSSVQMIMLIATPFYVGMSLTAGPLVETFFGPKWLAIIPIIAGLALAMPAMTLQIICSPATTALGRPGIGLFTSAVGAMVMPACYYFGVSRGPDGLVTAWHIAAPVLLAVTLFVTLRALEARLADLIKVLAPIAIGCLVMAIGVTVLKPLIQNLPALIRLSLLACAGAGIYAGTLWLFWPSIVRSTLAKLRKQQASSPEPEGQGIVQPRESAS